MQIHLFISDSTPAQNRIKATLKNILETNTVIHHQNSDNFDPVILRSTNEPIVSVIMPANNKELSKLVQNKKIFWEGSKNILILQDEEPKTLEHVDLIRPIYVTTIDDNFSNVALILNHIKNRFELNNQTKTM